VAPFLELLIGHLNAGLAALEEAREAGFVSIGTDRSLHLPALEALPTDGVPKRMRDLMFKEIGTVQFAKMIMEVCTGISEVLPARRARDVRELVSLYAALLSHGTDLDAKSAAATIPELDPTHMSTTMRALEMPGRLTRANERVVEFRRTHPITELWGTGRRASSDSMSLDTSPHLFYVRVDPRRRTHAVGIYTHFLDQHGIAYNQPFVLNEWQAGAAITAVRACSRASARKAANSLLEASLAACQIDCTASAAIDLSASGSPGWSMVTRILLRRSAQNCASTSVGVPMLPSVQLVGGGGDAVPEKSKAQTSR
jgi:hypothetical protein